MTANLDESDPPKPETGPPKPERVPPGARYRPGVLSRVAHAVALVVVVGSAAGLVVSCGVRPQGHSATPCPVGAAGCATSEPAQPSSSVGQPSASVSPQPAPSAVAQASPKPVSAGPASAAATGDFPDASSTGPRITALTRHDGNTSVTDNGAVISGWDLHGSLDIYANNVTIVDSRITSTNWWGVNLRPGFGGLKVLHSTITGVPGKGVDNGGEDYGISINSVGSVEVGWSNISQFGDAFATSHGQIHDNYVHDLSAFVSAGGEWNHSDSLGSGGADTGGLLVQHNTLLNPMRVDQGASAAVGLYADGGPVSNTTIERNLIAGGAYALYGGGSGATGIKVIGNVFSTQFWPNCGYYGTVTAWNAGGSGNVWSGNVTSAGKAVQP